MITFELKLWDDEGKKCSFYTVKKDTDSNNETDKFFANYENNLNFKQAAQELLSFIIYSIGDDHGANDKLFNRFENEVIGLPVKGKVRIDEITFYYPDFPLRLYALKITDEIVVLFNGGIKDGATNQQSSLNVHWMEACLFAKRIVDAIQKREIFVDNKNRILTNHLGDDEIML